MTVLDDRSGGLATLARRAGTGRHGPDWLAAARRAGADWIATHGFPSAKQEDWRYLPLDGVLGPPFELPGDEGDDPDGAAPPLLAASADLGGSRLVFVNGRLSPALSRRRPLPPRARLRTLADSQAAPPGWRPSSPVGAIRHGFDALNLALCADGAVLDLPAGTVVDEPIELVHLTVPGGRRLATSPRSVLRLGAGSRATVVETHAATPGAGYLAIPVTDVDLGEGARLEHHRVQLESGGAHHLSSLDVRQGPGSSLCARLVALGGLVARHEVVVRLQGEAAEAHLAGLYLPRGGQCLDQPVLVEHGAPGGISRQRFLGVVDEGGHGVFNGHVVVRPGAVRTDARQSNANLLLAEHAQVDTRPRLEIFADQVACSHGASVGRVDPDMLFYLRSRGIPEGVARAVLVQAFAGEVIDRIELPALRAHVSALVADRLAAPPERGEPGEPTGSGGR